MTVQSQTPTELVKNVYANLESRLSAGREALGRPLTLAEKILINHLKDPNSTEMNRGVSYVDLHPDRVAMQDATAQMAWLQFMTAGLQEVQVPTTTHCDHLIQARIDAETDLSVAVDNNSEVYDFLESVCAKYGAGFWKPGSGIIHQVILEQYAFPGGMMIGTDSHTPNAGGLGMIAIGVGGADAVDVMTGFPFNIKWPKLIGVNLTGELSGWASPKDVILKVAEILTVKGGTGAIVEYLGPGARTLSATGKGTICNMGAEIGATTSLFPYDEAISRYLNATNRGETAEAADSVSSDLQADPEVEKDPHSFFDRVIEINLSDLTPHINGPHTPDLARPVGNLGEEATANGWPLEVSAGLIGSCTNSSYEDITRAAGIARDALSKGLKSKIPLLVTPGSEQVRATIERDGLLADLEAIGATVLANACGPCIGQWDRQDLDEGMPNSIVTSYNRNFPKRNDGYASTFAFVTSPETVVALSIAGKLDFDPAVDSLTSENGEEVKLSVDIGEELPTKGFDPGEEGLFKPPPSENSEIEISIPPESERLQVLTPFAPWDGNDFENLPVLMKAKGKCTTDHISMAGSWLKYRGHLENISGNLYLGVVNSFTGEVGTGIDITDNEIRPFPEIAKRYHEAGIEWVAIGDENIGEGSSREHAAMEPRFRGCRVVIARSFARIHETNLKKQGVLPLTFANPADYDLIGQEDKISVIALKDLSANKPVQVTVTNSEGVRTNIETNHSMSEDQIEWFKAGSALNLIRQKTNG
ncbi:MAG: aconitate hydratase [Acidimicrobiales bacterium]|nr:aconitate hydratase [Acidimicrobiales bacterium]